MKKMSFDDIFNDVTRLGTKIPKDRYLSEGAFPVIDQGQEFIAGYVNSETGIFNSVPVVVFGDHTRILKYIDFPFFLGADGVKVLTVNKLNCLPKYAYYALKSARIPDTGYNRHFKWLKEMEFTVIPRTEQEKIVKSLDSICHLITLKKKQLNKLDQLASSRFIEMFVTSDEKEFSWNIQPLQLLADVVSGITKGRKTKCQNLISVPYMGVSNVKDGYINWSNLKTIDATQEEIKQYQLFPGDVLMTEGGDPDKVGRGAILNSVPQNCIHQNHIFRVRLHQDMVEPVFFAGYLQQKSVKQYFLKCAKQTTGIASINMTQLRSLPVILPPLELQNEFAAFIEQLDKSKVICNKMYKMVEFHDFGCKLLKGSIKMADKITNFDFLKREPEFNIFADAAIAADKLLSIDVISSVIRCRQAMEIAIKWMYSIDESLSMPYQATLDTLLKNSDFRDLVDNNQLLSQMDFIRKLGNRAVHESKNVSREQAELCLHNLWRFLQFVMFCYSRQYSDNDKFDTTLYLQEPQKEKDLPPPPLPEVDLQKLMAENAALKSELTALRTEKQPSYIPQPMDISEFKTRKVYIDTMLQDVGWIEKRNWQNEVELVGMPNTSGVGYADYVLYGDDGRPLAVVEAKKTCVDVSVGRQQAKLYADLLEQKYGRRPVVFLTNGFETRIIDNQYPERQISFIYSKRDLEKLFNLQSFKTSLKHIHINRNIAGRYYQEEAIKAVCNDFDVRNRRKALLVMATGSGKTRTVIELCNILLQHGWVRHILFLADRNSLVTQAKRSFTNLLPDLDLTNLCETREHCNAACVFSTYQTMINCIDSVVDDDGKMFSPGHFDLVICDEAHRSIYNKYQEIFTYFDAPLVGLTATPKDEIDKNTYEIFELENGVPTYGYELAQAVKDGFLVDFLSIETELKFLSGGIVYDELSEEDKKEYEATFADEDGNIPALINASALNEWIFNRDTIRQVLNTLMTKGIKIDYGQNIGKTVIFAKSHEHAEKIKKIFDEEYPHLPGYAMVIDHQTNYAQSAIDEFSDSKQLPQIAISVDMLDTGIDVPEVLNLVFFKKVLSKAKFWQMIGRGTRLCPGLLDGNDKERFYIFDFCGNFDFFRMKGGNDVLLTIPLQGAIFYLKAQMACKLQDLAYQTDALIQFRQRLVDEMVGKVQELNRNNFAVRQHLKYVEIYSDPQRYTTLTYEDTLMMRDELVPLIMTDKDEPTAVRFDALLYGIELAFLAGKPWGKRKSDLMKKVQGIASVANIPEIMAQKDLIDKILHTDYISTADISDFEYIRKQLRDLIKYIPKVHLLFETNLDDEILNQVENKTGGIGEDELPNYKAKAEYYIRQHMDVTVIAKLRSNIPLTNSDIQILEQVLWNELGSKDEYEKAFGSIPLGEFVRGITGLDMNAAKQAFASFLNDASLNSQQIYFVNQIIEYIVHNGVMKDLSVLQEAPFSDFGDISEIFTDLSVWDGIYSVITSINSNASVA